MCGLVGVASFEKRGLSKAMGDAFINLLVIDSVRGAHGTGMFIVTPDGKRSGMKVAGNPYNLLYTKNFDSFADVIKKDISIMAGHNRYATRGGVTNKDSHPFYHGHITLMHNGTLTEEKHLPKQFDIDSEAIAYSVAEKGIEHTLGSIRGAYALVYYDSKEKTLNMVRNYERPLFLAKWEHHKAIMWASEELMIDWVIDRNHLAQKYTIKEIPTHTLYSFSLETGELSIKSMPFTGEKIPVSQGTIYNNWDDDVPFSAKDGVPEKGQKNLPMLYHNRDKREIVTVKQKPHLNLVNGLPKIDMIVSKDGQIYKPGDPILVNPFDEREMNLAREKYQIICKRDDFDDSIVFKVNVIGKDLKAVFMEEPFLGANIAHINKISRPDLKDVIVVWLDPTSLQMDHGKGDWQKNFEKKIDTSAAQSTVH